MTVLHGAPEKQQERTGEAPAPTGQGPQCPECREAFVPRHPRQLFCSDAHKQAFHNRATVRGRAIVPLIMAARITRGGSRGDTATGRRARQDAEQLIGRWIAEDREAGRGDMVAYVRLRLAKGFDLG